MPDNTVLDKKSETKSKKPRKFKVIILNDDFTPMDFVTTVLMSFFNKNLDEAASITMDIHRKGQAVVGLYTMEVAETKISLVANAARAREYPLTAVLSPE